MFQRQRHNLAGSWLTSAVCVALVATITLISNSPVRAEEGEAVYIGYFEDGVAPIDLPDSPTVLSESKSELVLRSIRPSAAGHKTTSSSAATASTSQQPTPCTGQLTQPISRTAICTNWTMGGIVYKVQGKRVTITGEFVYDVTLKQSAIKNSRTWTTKISINSIGSWGDGKTLRIWSTLNCVGNCSIQDNQALFHSTNLTTTSSRTYTASNTKSDLSYNSIKITQSAILDSQGTSKNATLAQSDYMRCDRGKAKANTQGCVASGWQPYVKMSRSDPLVNETAQHIYDVLKLRPGLGAYQPGVAKQPNTGLTRLSPGSPQIATNRTKSCPKSLTRPIGKECDEFPFASTEQGGQTFSGARKMVDKYDNQRAGVVLTSFYLENRIIAGERFWVWIT